MSVGIHTDGLSMWAIFLRKWWLGSKDSKRERERERERKREREPNRSHIAFYDLGSHAASPLHILLVKVITKVCPGRQQRPKACQGHTLT